MTEAEKETARVLIVDDEVNLAEGIQENLIEEGYAVDMANDGLTGLEMIRANSYDLVILDVMMPGLDGFSVCEKVRQDGCDVPILFLTARDGMEDRVRGLEGGGDDYLSKPFHLKEFLLRVRAILRRRVWYESFAESRSVVRFGGNTIDFRTYLGEAWDGREHSLTQKEAMILRVLAESTGQVVTREQVLDKVWGYEIFPSTRTVDNFIVRLRKRFERNPEDPIHILTVRGVGYRFIQEIPS